MSGEARSEAQQTLEDLRDQRDAFVSDLDEVSADSAKAWGDVKDGLDRAWADLEAAAKSAMERFGEPPSGTQSPDPDDTGGTTGGG